MDFETVNPAIPRFAGMRPYDHLPFQWSVHVQRAPEAKLEHFEFLATDGSDPRCEFITSVCEALGESGSIVVYNAGFESQRLAELAVWLPEFADADREHPVSTVGLAARHSQPRLPSCIREDRTR